MLYINDTPTNNAYVDLTFSLWETSYPKNNPLPQFIAVVDNRASSQGLEKLPKFVILKIFTFKYLELQVIVIWITPGGLQSPD